MTYLRRELFVFYGLWLLLLLMGFVFSPNPAPTGRLSIEVRLAALLCLTAANWRIFAHCRSSRFVRFIALGLSIGWLSDFIIAALRIYDDFTSIGLAGFVMMHLFYISAFLQHRTPRQGDLPLTAGIMTAVSILWFVGFYRHSDQGLLPTLSGFYALLMAFTAATAAQSRKFAPALLGTILILVADLILAAQLFNGLAFPFITDAIWVLYEAGQAAIVWSAALHCAAWANSH